MEAGGDCKSGGKGLAAIVEKNDLATYDLFQVKEYPWTQYVPGSGNKARYLFHLLPQVLINVTRNKISRKYPGNKRCNEKEKNEWENDSIENPPRSAYEMHNVEIIHVQYNLYQPRLGSIGAKDNQSL
jgi:hypothetical protein